jgi:hypothetical protein
VESFGRGDWPYKRLEGAEYIWGARQVVEGDEKYDLKKKFEEALNGNEALFASIQPKAFRWTCCGDSLASEHPCDHHGRGSTACSCDFCVMGLPVQRDSRKPSVHNYGLDIPIGPDPRSYDPAVAGIKIGLCVKRRD